MATKLPNGCKTFQMAIKYTNIFHSRALQKIPKLGLLVWKYIFTNICRVV
jgi:hypothetical protein